jgi:small-conductance mechanosensitive channel
MSGEQRVTDEAVQHIVVHGRVPTGGLATQYEIRLANALAEERLCTANLDTMGRATEAKLRDALDDIERRRKLANDDGETIRSWANRATAAESALAATKAKLEAAEAVLRVVHEQFECPARNTNRGRAYREGVLVSNDVREMVSAAIATKEAPDATAE